MASNSSPRSSAYSPEPKGTLNLVGDVQDMPCEDHTEMRMDGGFHAWATVVGGFLTTTVTFGYLSAFGVYQDIYTRSGTASASKISWIGSTTLFLLLAMGLPAGKLLDMGYFRYTNLAGSIIFVFSLFMVSLAHHDKYYEIYLCQGIGIGIGAGLLYVPALAIQAHHWRERRALAMAIAISGTSIGGIIFPIMLNQLFKGPAGFAWGVRASALLCCGLLLLSNVLMTTNPAVLSQDRPKPDLKGILTDVPYLLAALGIMFTLLGLFFPYFYLQLFAIVHGIDKSTAFYTIAILNVGSLFGRIIPSLFTGRLGALNSVTPCAAGCGILILAMFGIGTVVSTFIFAILYGFFSGAFSSLSAPALASLSRDPSEIGIRFGVAFFINSFGALTGPPVIGALLGPRFLWYRPIVFGSISIFVGTFLLLLSRQMVSKRKGSQFV